MEVLHTSIVTEDHKQGFSAKDVASPTQALGWPSNFHRTQEPSKEGDAALHELC